MKLKVENARLILDVFTREREVLRFTIFTELLEMYADILFLFEN